MAMESISGEVMRVRCAVPADAAAMAALIRGTFAAYEGKLVPPPSALKETAESVAARLGKGGGFLAEAGDALAGCVLYERRGGEVYLGRLAIADGYRRRGLARTLIVAVEAAARAFGASRLTAEVRIALPANRRLFAACGFREVARRAHPGFDRPTYLELRKILAAL